jgi:hypothetical protein
MSDYRHGLDWWLNLLITLTHDSWLHFTFHCYTHTSVSVCYSLQQSLPSNGSYRWRLFIFHAHVITVWPISCNWTEPTTSLHLTQLNCTQLAWCPHFIASGQTQHRTPASNSPSNIVMGSCLVIAGYCWHVYWPLPSMAGSFSWSLHSNGTTCYEMMKCYDRICREWKWKGTIHLISVWFSICCQVWLSWVLRIEELGDTHIYYIFKLYGSDANTWEAWLLRRLEPSSPEHMLP